MKMQNKILGLFLFSIIAVLLVSSVSAVTLISPATNGVISGLYIFNVTNSSLPNLINCTIYAKSASTANSTYTKIAYLSNTTGVQASINVTLNLSNILEDSNDYLINASCRNQTGSLSEAINTGVTVDYTIPVAPSSLLPATNTLNNTAGSGVYFSATTTDPKTTSCTFTRGINGGNYHSFSATNSGTSCTYTDASLVDSSDNGIYTWYMTSSDGTNVTSSTSNILNLEMIGANGGLPANTQTNTNTNVHTTATTQNNNDLVILIIVAVAIVVFIVVRRR